MKITNNNNKFLANYHSPIYYWQYSGENKLDNYEKQKASDINITQIKGIYDLFGTEKMKNKKRQRVNIITESAEKINDYLEEKGYQPCKNIIISNFLVNRFFNSQIGGRYLPFFDKIAIAPFMGDDKKECEFIILHEQAHYLHNQKLKKQGLKFKSQQLEPEEKRIVADCYKEIFKNRGMYNDETDKTIDKIYLENNLEFVGYYFAFKNWGINFNTDTDKIYKKYNGPEIM